MSRIWLSCRMLMPWHKIDVRTSKFQWGNYCGRQGQLCLLSTCLRYKISKRELSIWLYNIMDHNHLYWCGSPVFTDNQKGNLNLKGIYIILSHWLRPCSVVNMKLAWLFHVSNVQGCVYQTVTIIPPYIWNKEVTAWWCHQMENFSALLAICAGNSPVTGECPAQRPVTRSFDVLFDLSLKRRLSKQSCGW